MADPWSCLKCTYYHKYSCQRCQMCGSLRVTKEQMRNFVAGKSGSSGGNADDDADGADSSTNIADNGVAQHADRSRRPRPAEGGGGASASTAGGRIEQRPRSLASSGHNGASSSSSSRQPGAAANFPPPPARSERKLQPANPYSKRRRSGCAAGASGERSSTSDDVNGTSSGAMTTAATMPHCDESPSPRTPDCAAATDPRGRGGSRTPSSSGVLNPYAERSASSAATTGLPPPPSTAVHDATVQRQHQNQHQQRQQQHQQHQQHQQIQHQQRQRQITASGASNQVHGIFTGANSRRCPSYREGPMPLCPNTSHNWIYPVDDKYPERIYQLEMSRASVMQNTLVSLPTGLGKTLIAAVVMYNYHRWFPTGKVVFCAPTRPLVSQQIHACYKIMGIPEGHTAEISGRSKPESRDAMWLRKRVFFCTPQTLVKDIEEGRCEARSIVCVVMDEAHRATGEHANAVLVRRIAESGARFRLVGLSATPGTDIKSIQAVVNTLNISKIECRTEEDENVKKYIHDRAEEVIVVKQPDAVNALDRQFGELMAPILSRLREERVMSHWLRHDSANLGAYSVMQAHREYFQNPDADRRLNAQFNILRELAGVRQNLKQYGVQSARAKLAECGRKSYMAYVRKQPKFLALVRDVEAASGAGGRDEGGGGTAEGEGSSDKNNPKLIALAEVLVEHFERKRAIGESTRVIVFSQWRESVVGIVKMLSAQNALLIKPAQFIGQASKRSNGGKGRIGHLNSNNTGQDVAGMNQKQQQKVLQQFSEGTFNVLVCTCVGEEGLDIGEVDLIVNFDVMKSPIRSIQRSGRTGRKRNGRVVFLVAEGQEQRSYAQSVQNTKKIARALSNPSVFKLCPNVPMFPAEPNLLRKKMNVNSFHLSQVGGHTPKTRGRNKGAAKKRRPQIKAIESDWRLDPAQEEERRNLFGELPPWREDESTSKEFPSSLKRKYLNTRMLRNGTKQATTMGFGKSSTILQQLEKKHGAAREMYVSTNELSHVTGNNVGNPVESNGSDSDCRLMDVGSDRSVVVCDKNDGDEDDAEISKISINHSLDKIFGPIIEDVIYNPLQMTSLFDEAHHKSCAVIAPPGMALDNSDEETESVSSALSVMSMNDDLCAFFEKDNSNDLRVEPCRQTHDEDEKSAMMTPCSDHGSDDDFGAHDIIDFGTPHDMNNNGANDVMDSCSNQLVDASRCFESTMKKNSTEQDICGAKKSTQKSNREEGKTDLVCEKENINFQLSLSPIFRNDESSVVIEERRSYQSSDEGAENNCIDHTPQGANDETVDERLDANEHIIKEVQSPVVASFHLPTPPPSSDESDDGCSDSGAQQNESPSRGFEDIFVGNAGSKEVSFFELPTQDSSSSEDDDDENIESNRQPSDHVSTAMENSLQPQTPAVATAFQQDQSRPDQSLVDTPECRRVHFNTTSFNKMAAAEELTDTPIKSPFTVTDTNKSGANSKTSLDSLTDTPILCRQNVGEQRNALCSLTDTPQKCSKNVGQQRKRLRPAPRNEGSCEKPVDGSADKLQRKDRLKKRLEDKYRCRFLDCEAANDDSQESDEEDAIREIEEDENSHDSFINDTSQLGYSQDELDKINADAEVECIEGECTIASVLHRQFDHQLNMDERFKTPVFNRRMRKSASQSPAESSQKGLGNMNFIRSVLEHAAAGGDADQLEEAYNELAGNGLQSQQANDESNAESPIQPMQPSKYLGTGPQNSTCPNSHRSFQVELGSQQHATCAIARRAPAVSSIVATNNQPVVLSSEQRAMIEAKRLEALKRRQQRMQQKAVPSNPYSK